MANHKSADKRNRQSQKRRMNNKVKTTRVRTEVKKMRAAIEAKDKETAVSLFPAVQRLFAKLAKTSAMRKETAARRVSRIASQVAQL